MLGLGAIAEFAIAEFEQQERALIIEARTVLEITSQAEGLGAGAAISDISAALVLEPSADEVIARSRALKKLVIAS